MSATKYGDCLITVATGEMGDAEAERVGLVPTHAYAVLQVPPTPPPSLSMHPFGCFCPSLGDRVRTGAC